MRKVNNSRVLRWVIGVLPFYLFTFLPLQARVTLPSFFSDNMVLQQQSECNIWGWTEPGKKVIVHTPWDKKSHRATARKDGRFEVTIQTPKAGGPYDIWFQDGDFVKLSNVMIGEVWICSGQSNMEMQMKGYKAQPVEGATEELLSCKDDELRLFYVRRREDRVQRYEYPPSWRV